MDIPNDLINHIHEISQEEFSWLQPTRKGILNDPFFRESDVKDTAPFVEPRTVYTPLPEELISIYQKYSDDTEFKTDCGWTFLSEQDISENHEKFKKNNQKRVIDIALRYMGMGHVELLVYDPDTKMVFMDRDGGSNGWDRESNWQRRINMDVGEVDKVSLLEWKRHQGNY